MRKKNPYNRSLWQKKHLQAEKEYLQQEKEQLQEQVAQLSAELINLRDHHTSSQQKNSHAKLQREKEQLQQDKEQLQQQNNQLQEQIAQLSAEVTANHMLEQQKGLSEESWKISQKDVSVTEEELGRGGWGVIWIGQFRGQRVAVKQMHDAIKSQVNLDLLHRKINTMSQLRHPNLLQFIGAVFDHPSGNPMIITEVMDTSLRKAYEDKHLTPTLACQPVSLSIMRDVAVGLNYLHCLRDPIIHRDVSSANVLLESKGSRKWKTKISDFGSANKAKQANTVVAGALVYSAPESLQAVNAISHGRNSPQTIMMDVFSYGVLFCELLNCTFPDRESFSKMLKEVRSRSEFMFELVNSCLKEKPADRPSMNELIRQLDNLTKK